MQVGQLQPHGHLHREVDEVVIEKRHARLKAVGHAELVFDHEHAVQEGARLEVQRVVDATHRVGAMVDGLRKDVAKNVARPDLRHLGPDRRQCLTEHGVGHQPLPMRIVLVDVGLEVSSGRGARVAPRIPAKQLVAAGARQDYLHELARQLGDVEVRVTLADSRFLEMPRQPRHHMLHVAGLEHHLVLLGAKQVRHALGPGPLVEAKLEAGSRTEIEAAREGLQPWLFRRRHGGDRTRIDAAAQVAAELNVAHQLAFDGLAEQPIQFLRIGLIVGRLVRLGEVVVPVLHGGRVHGATLREREMRSGRQQPHAGKQRPVRQVVLEREVLDQALLVERG